MGGLPTYVLRAYNMPKIHIDKSIEGMAHRVRALKKSKGKLTVHDVGRSSKEYVLKPSKR